MGLFTGLADAIGIGARDIFSAGTSLLGSAFQASQQGSFLNQQQAFQAEQTGTAYQRAVKDMTAAGLNPAAMYGGHAGPAQSGSGGAVPNIDNPGARAIETAAAQSQIKVNTAQAALLEANAQKAISEKAEIEARTPTYAQTIAQSQVTIDQMRQQIAESMQRINTLAAQATSHYASAAQATQQTENLRAELPRIQATIRQLNSLANLQGAQLELVAKQSGKTVAEMQEIQQRIHAGLPSLQRSLAELDAQAKRLDMPKREQEAGAQEGFVGALGAVLKTLNPLNNFLGQR